MTVRQKIISASAIVSSLLILGGAYAKGVSVGTDVMHKKFGYPPFARLSTELVVAGWQADRVNNDMRDIKGRIERLEIKKKLPGTVFNYQDQKELDYWYGEYKRNEEILKAIEQTRSPVWMQSR